MKPGRLNIDDEKAGARFTLGVNLCDEEGTAVDLTGYTGAFKIRYRADSPNVLLEASTANGRLTLGGTPFNAVVDCDLAIAPGRYEYDLAVFSADGHKWPMLTGRFEVEASAV